MASQPVGMTTGTPPWPGARLADFLRTCLGSDPCGSAPHVDLFLGDVDQSDLEPVVYRLLGVTDDATLLVGVSCTSTGDLAACHKEWGEPAYRIDLGDAPGSPACWELWRMSGAQLAKETVAAAGLVLREDDPPWVLYTDPEEATPRLFPRPAGCGLHPARSLAAVPRVESRPPTAPGGGGGRR